VSAPESRPVIVVGVDGSPLSKQALQWAAKQSQLSAAQLRAVIAWRWPTTYGWAPDYAGFDFAADARKTLEEAVTETLGAPPSVPVSISVIEGHPAPVLIDASRSADLLVVGSHGHGAFTGMLLGSVSQHCVQHATCPVLVYRPPTP
jgi:nucleotide-binding universal stress UspA family protein